jgi:hypothetical protein
MHIIKEICYHKKINKSINQSKIKAHRDAHRGEGWYQEETRLAMLAEERPYWRAL